MNHIRQSGWGEKACYGGQEADGSGKYGIDRHGFKFITVCCICHQVLSSAVDMTLAHDEVSHGLCRACELKHYPEVKP